jgi:4-amino-4-deoxy-L-arabinose transferase-like glycosyltransferase
MIIGVYALGRRLFGTPVARAAAFLIAVSPAAVFFGRTVMGDSMMVAFSVGAVLAAVTYFDTGRHLAAVLCGASLGLAALVKLPAVLAFAPVLFTAWRARRFAALRDPWFVIPIGVALAVTGAWYWHAHNLYLQTGLTFGIWGPGGYPPDIARFAGSGVTFDPYASWQLLTDIGFYDLILDRVWVLYLTPAGFAVALFGGMVAWSTPRASIVAVWLGAGVAFVLVGGGGNRLHEYYQLPLLPPVALFFGLAAAPAFDFSSIRRWFGPGMRGPIVVGAALVLIALLSFRESAIVPRFFRAGSLDMGPVHSGIAIDRATRRGSLLIVVEATESVGASASPMLLYHAHRRGWTFDATTISPHVIEYLKSQGATHFATLVNSGLQAQRPDVAWLLEQHEAVPLANAPPNTALFDLR